MSVDARKVEKAVRWAVAVDSSETKAFVQGLRARYPGKDNRTLAKKIYSRTAWKGASVGLVAGLPANLVVAIPAAVLDAAVVLRMEVTAAGRVAVIYEPTFLDDDDAPWELLAPIFGMDVVSQALRELGVKAGQQVTKQLIKKYLSKETLKQFQRIMLKVFGMKVLQKAVVAKTVPIVGGLIGGTWNFVEVHLQGRRVIKYFEGETLGTTAADESR
jgi:hypothetical protein